MIMGNSSLMTHVYLAAKCLARMGDRMATKLGILMEFLRKSSIKKEYDVGASFPHKSFNNVFVSRIHMNSLLLS